jgi:hypothetical protein
VVLVDLKGEAATMREGESLQSRARLSRPTRFAFPLPPPQKDVTGGWKGMRVALTLV